VERERSPKRDDSGVVDWGAGDYEATAAELAPVAEAVVERARISAGEDVLDVACRTGNAALLAAARGARVVGVDAARRLLEVAREARAHRELLSTSVKGTCWPCRSTTAQPMWSSRCSA